MLEIGGRDNALHKLTGPRKRSKFTAIFDYRGSSSRETDIKGGAEKFSEGKLEGGRKFLGNIVITISTVPTYF